MTPQQQKNGYKGAVAVLIGLQVLVIGTLIKVSVDQAAMGGNRWTSLDQARHMEQEATKHQTLVERMHRLELKLKEMEARLK